VRVQNRASETACARGKEGRMVAQGARACNVVGGAARETDWGGADLPRVRPGGAEQGAASGRDVPSGR
jgi:hypothetical protein